MMNHESLNLAVLQDFFDKGDQTGAVLYLTELLNSVQSDPDERGLINYHLGRIFFYKNDLSQAKQQFISALKNNQRDLYSKIYLSKILKSEKKYKSALRLLEYAVDQNQDYTQIYNCIVEDINFLQFDDDSVSFLNDFDYSKKASGKPKISIIILCYNKLEYTQKCLSKLFANTEYDNFEVIIVDNASIDDTPGYLESFGNKITLIHSEKNLGFVNGNNLAVQSASGEYVVFLNNDTEPQPNWLEALYDIFKFYPDAGAAGSMLLYPDGKLQEAGGVIFNNATGWNYGKNQNPVDSKFSFVREVDYCSGAALMVRKDVFDKLGGFDTRYSPAYFEDTDLCFGIRELGYKVYYTPFSKVIHYEGVTAGTDLSKGFKRFQLINTPKFTDKWQQALKKQYPDNADLFYQFSNRRSGKRILIIDDIPPLPDRAAGALRHYHTLTQMINLGYTVTYVHLMGKQYSDESGIKYMSLFRMKGVEFIWFNYEYWWAFRETPQVNEYLDELIGSLDLKRRKYDLVYIAFWHIAEYFVDRIRKHIPSVPILIDTMDLHYLRELRQAELSNNPELKKTAEKNKKRELALYSKADCITTVTEKDRSELQQYLPSKSILILTDVHDPVDSKTEFDERRDFLFIGNFNHNPNEDAVIYFSSEIFPLIKRSLPEAKFYIVGNNPTEKVKQLASEDIIVTGWVAEVKPYLDKCRVSVVPLRFGAGNKGKVGETLSHGLPMVSTSVGAEGMDIINEYHSYIADESSLFAEYCIKLYNQKSIWESFSERGKNLIGSMYSSEKMRNRLEYIMSFGSREAFKGYPALNYPNPPRVSIILVAYNQITYTLKTIASIKEHTKISHEIILIDNASSDHTLEQVTQKYTGIRLIINDLNRGFPCAANQGISAAVGEYILLLNNDVIVTEGWLERLAAIADGDQEIGLVGPVSNSVSGFQLDRDAKYESIDKMHVYAEKLRIKNKGKFLAFPRIAFLCTLIKKELINKIGGLDERFSPGNFEDDDFCLRTQLEGYKTVIAQDVFIHHFGSRSFGASGTEVYNKRIETNRKIFIEKWGADPDEIWIKGRQIKQRQTNYPLNKDLFIQSFERSLRHIDENELELAADEIIKAIASFHTSKRENYSVEYPDVLNLAGNIFLLLKDYSQAVKYFEQVIALIPDSSVARKSLEDAGRLLLQEENIDVPDQQSLNVSSTESVDSMNLLIKAEEYINQDNYAEAEKLLKDILYKDNGHLDALNDLALINILKQEYETALRIIERILEADPDNEIAVNNLQYLNEQLK